MSDPRQQSEPSAESNAETLQREQIDRARSTFEAAWRSGEAPRIEAFLGQVNESLRAVLLSALIATEVGLRRASGDNVGVDEYRRRFPLHATAVETGWARMAGRKMKGDTVSSTVDVSGNVEMSTSGATPTADARAQANEMPAHIGRYEILERLGEGGFGRVYLANDPQLQRKVAIKVPRRKWLASEKKIEAVLHEARSAAQLKHPALVAVHDVQQDGDEVYIVQEYVDGHDLRRWAESNQPTVDRVVRLMMEVADAIGCAHQQDLIHRDLKPGNILIDRDEHVHVLDFGLALHESLHRLRRGEVSGTPAYMSPEQVRGETHRLDGRTDLWSIGVILYELLTRRRPFRGGNQAELFDEIKHRDPKPLRQITPTVPSELERICLKCLEKRRTARYRSAAELSDDLRAWLPSRTATQAGSTRDGRHQDPTPRLIAAPRVVPKGLRAFDAHDADFFLDLLPGPRDRDGLPESVRFWKTRIEQIDPEGTFSVGLIYGPSGCGKTSLVKAGLLPRLNSRVTPIYIEATPRDTEGRLRKGVRGRLDGIPADMAIADLLGEVREGTWLPEGQKVLIVLDQFEQWLHAWRGEHETPMVQALRHCDGARLQCIVLVRNDFFLAANRFMQELEVSLLEGRNMTLVDLFDPLHARTVLAEFGHAFGRLPSGSDALSRDQNAFLARAVKGLARDGKIVCVRLAMFADMLKGKPWSTTTLKQMGGMAGLGVTFLEETFSASTAPPAHRYHQAAIQAVLKTLLPEADSDIKGSMQSYRELLVASNYAHRTHDFDELIRILDSELRLITPTDPKGADTESARKAEPSLKYYQLTHDYLVPALRDWLTRKQKETRRGRAALRLAERSMQWTAKPERRNLPKTWEDLSIRLFARKKTWTGPQRRMMRQSGLVHGGQTLAVVALVLAGSLSGLIARRHFLAKQNATRAADLVTALLKADIQQVPSIINEIDRYRPWTDPLLEKDYRTMANDSPEKLKLALALLPVDSSRLDYLYDRLLKAAPNEVVVVRDALLPHTNQLVMRLWTLMRTADEAGGPKRLRAACALAVMDGANARWRRVADRVVSRMVHVRPAFVAYWQQALLPVKDVLAPSLVSACHDATLTSTERALATDLLAGYAADRPELLARAIQYADDQQFALFLPLIEASPAAALPVLKACLSRELTYDWQDPPLDPAWTAPAEFLARKFHDAHGVLAERFAFCQTLPLTEFQDVAESLRASGYRPTRCRPFLAGADDQSAAIWVRDGQPWCMKTGTADDIVAADKRLRPDAWQAIDIAGFVAPSGDGKHQLRFAALWTKPNGKAAPRRLFVARSPRQWLQVRRELESAGFKQIDCYNIVTSDDGKKHVSAICGRADTPSILYDAPGRGYSGQLHQGLLQVDVALSRAARPVNARESSLRKLEAAEKMLAVKPDDVFARVARAVADYRLGNDKQALDDLNLVVAARKDHAASVAYEYRALVLARLGKKQEAVNDLAKFLTLFQATGGQNVAGEKRFVDVVVAARLGMDDEAVQRLENEIARHSMDPEFLMWAARAYSVASKAGHDATKQSRYADRAVTLVQKAIRAGYDDFAGSRTDPHLEPIRANARFVELLRHAGLDRCYAAAWDENPVSESIEVHGLAPADHLARCQDLIVDGYRPASIAVLDLGAAPAPTGDGLTRETATVWHRPLIPEGAKEALAKRQANAAVALLKLNTPAPVWPVFQHRPDPRARSYLIHRVGPLHVSPQMLAKRLLDPSEDTSARRALALCLGDVDLEQLPLPARDQLVKSLLAMYHDQPDAGLHAALRWLLCRWDHKADVLKLDTALVESEQQLAARTPGDRRRWYVTTQGQTMVVIQGGKFPMGSPSTDPEHHVKEVLHRKNVGRCFALSATEVTRGQWRRFVEQNKLEVSNYLNDPRVTVVVRTEDSPMVVMTWYESAAYCNWLSAREGIPKDQWCYQRNAAGKYASGMRPKPKFLSLHGYRLPSEAEWEYACRAGATTVRFFGQTDELLPEYAWYDVNSDLHTWPVASLKPNDWGLFDIQGNVWDWCQDRANDHTGPETDPGDETPILDEATRALRGASFDSQARDARAAFYLNVRPDNRNTSDGFRVARTYP